ncbi:hypothetical protein FQZ97_1133380 [compost metagenome]
MILIVLDVYESGELVREGALASVVSKLTINHTVAFFADQAVDALDQKLQCTVFRVEDNSLLNHFRNIFGVSQLFEAVNDGSFQCYHGATSISMMSI